MPIRLDACVAQHQGDRNEQQDRVALLPHDRQKGVALAVVADGMGGHTGGALAAEQVVHTAKNNLLHFSAQDSPRELLYTSMVEAHTMIKASRFLNEKDPHSTAVMLLIQPGRVSWGHCGDSRLYHFKDDRMVRRTTDHSYVEHLVQRGKITPEQALVHPNRNVLLTSLGGREEPKFDYAETTDIGGGNSFLLCSDGLWAYFSEEEMAGIVAGFSARQASEILIARARERGKGEGDNISVAIVKFIDVPAPLAKPPAPRT